MTEEMLKTLKMFHEEIKITLRDRHINNFTRWKYQKYEALCLFLLNVYGL